MPAPKRERTIERNGSVHPTDGQTLVQPRLSPRQWEVANLVACGLADCEIAAKLGISENTVGDHLKVLFRRYGVHTRTALAMDFLRDACPKASGDFGGTPTNVGLPRRRIPL